MLNKHLLLLTTCLVATIAMAQTAPAAASGGKPAFSIGVTDRLHSAVLGEARTLNIYLPAGYEQDDTTRYAVIYLLDGSADEDFIHVAGAVQFLTFPWIEAMPKSIVVGIANTDRRRDFTFPTGVAAHRERWKTTGGSADFIRFLETELQPYIAKQYRTDGSKTLVGQSLGGLLATEILLKKPALFDRYLIISPSLWWDNGSLLAATGPVLEAAFTQKTQVYIAVGKEGVVADDVPRVMEVDANLLADRLKRGKSPALTVYFDYLPEEDHATIGHQAVFNGLKRLYGRKQ